MNDQNFKELVNRAISMLPQEIRAKMNNIAVCIEPVASREELKKVGVRYKNNLLGLYEGIPQNVYGRGGGNNLPDKITIFREPIEMLSSNPKELEDLVRDVVWHEIAHHFGFEEKEISILEKKRKAVPKTCLTRKN